MSLCAPRGCALAMRSDALLIKGSGVASSPLTVNGLDVPFGSREKSGWLIPSSLGTTTSDVYVDWPPVSTGGPLTTTFVKALDATVLNVRVQMSCMSTGGANVRVVMGVNIDGVDHDVCYGFVNPVDEVADIAGAVDIAGFVAGPRVVTLRVMRGENSAAGSNIAANGSMQMSWTIRELIPGGS